MRKVKIDWYSLLDPNMDKKIVRCNIAQVGYLRNEITVTYEDGTREVIWHYIPARFDYESKEFIGMTKIEAAFYCDRKQPRRDDCRSRYTRGTY